MHSFLVTTRVPSDVCRISRVLDWQVRVRLGWITKLAQSNTEIIAIVAHPTGLTMVTQAIYRVHRYSISNQLMSSSCRGVPKNGLCILDRHWLPYSFNTTYYNEICCGFQMNATVYIWVRVHIRVEGNCTLCLSQSEKWQIIYLEKLVKERRLHSYTETFP